MSPNAEWTLDPGAIVLVLGIAAACTLRWRTVRRTLGPAQAPVWRLVCALAGTLAIAAALISPIDALGEQILTMHMVQHLLLLDIAPILLLAASTRVLLRPATRRLQRIEQAAGPLAHPAAAIAAYVAVMWIWHIPAFYDRAAENVGWHLAEHASFAAAGFAYWWHLLSPVRSRQMRGAAPVVYMVATKLLVGMLGIVLTFAPDALYGHYADQPRYWGLSAEADQAVAGLIMALEQSLIMGVALAWLFVRWMNEAEREAVRAERYGEG